MVRPIKPESQVRIYRQAGLTVARIAVLMNLSQYAVTEILAGRGDPAFYRTHAPTRFDREDDGPA